MYETKYECQSGKIQDVKKSHQNDYFKQRKYFLNQEKLFLIQDFFTLQQELLSVCKTF